MNLEQDLTFALSEFGVRIAPLKGSEFKALFDYQQIDFDTSDELSTVVNQPTLTCQEADLRGINRDAVLKVEGRGHYVVDSIEPDGTGLARVTLRRR